MNLKNCLSLFLFISFMLITSLVSSQLSGPNQQELHDTFELEIQQSELDSLINWQERILLHIDKPIISQEVPLFFKAYTLTGLNRVRASLSKVLKVELINQDKDLLVTQYHKIEDGMSKGAFRVPKKLENGTYTLRAYTRWMQNYGESFYAIKKLILGDDKNKSTNAETNREEIIVSFHPEGGNLVSGINNRLLIKAMDVEENPIDLDGEIIDSSGNKIMPVVSFANGIMSTIFNPNDNEQYLFKTTDGDLFELPTVLEKGYVLNVNNLNAPQLSIAAKASPEIESKSIWIKGETRGVTYFNKQLEFKNSVAELEIPKQGIPSGVMTISLVDENENKMAERPVFIDFDNTLKLSIIPLSETTENGEVSFKVRVNDRNDQPVITEISLSATNLIAQRKTHQINESGGFTWENDDTEYTDNNSSIRTERFIKDLELLTSNNTSNFHSIPNRIKYPFQKGLDLFGYAYDLKNTLLKNTKVQMLSTSNENIVVKELKTDSSGRIRIENLQLTGENELIFRTEGDDSKSRLVKLVPIQESYDKNHNSKPVLAFNKQKNKEKIQASPWEPLNSKDLVELDEVEVSEQKIERKRAMQPVYGMEAASIRTAVQDIEKPKFLFQLLSEIPGLRVMGSLEYPTIGVSRGFKSLSAGANGSGVLDQPGPLWVIDGFIWGNERGIVPEMGLNSWGIDRIEFFPPVEASMYGSRASLGVFYIYTRNGSDIDFVNRKAGRLNFQGYSDSPNFDNYAELIAKRPKRFEGKVTTLFWNPSIKTDVNGEATIRFTPPIAYKNLEFRVSTVTEKGEIASVKAIF